MTFRHAFRMQMLNFTGASLRSIVLATMLTLFGVFALVSASPANAAFDLQAAYAVSAAEDEQYPDWCDDYDEDWWNDCPVAEDQPEEDSPEEDYWPEDPPPAPPAPPAPEPDWDQPDWDQPDRDGPGWEPPQPNWPPTPTGAVARIAENGRTAIAPRRAPRIVKDMIQAANRITRKPYKWGGGHGQLTDSGYDCSGATSYVLRAVGLMNGSMVSGSFKRWGVNGSGKWVNVYANNGHVFIVIAGLRFDTSGQGQHGPRWRSEPRGSRGFKLRHPRKL
ncbi:MAG: hypothetical protein WAP35_07430 [Solirubrobacterales bacterium]